LGELHIVQDAACWERKFMLLSLFEAECIVVLET